MSWIPVQTQGERTPQGSFCQIEGSSDPFPPEPQATLPTAFNVPPWELMRLAEEARD